jgi:hypothetical protein
LKSAAPPALSCDRALKKVIDDVLPRMDRNAPRATTSAWGRVAGGWGKHWIDTRSNPHNATYPTDAATRRAKSNFKRRSEIHALAAIEKDPKREFAFLFVKFEE